MKIILHLALSADGFIAKLDGNSDWVSPVDTDLFLSRAKEASCVVVGKRTFEQYQGQLFPIEKVVNFVLTSKPGSGGKNVFFVSSPQEAVILAKKNGCKNILIGGGGKTSAAFLNGGLIDEIFFSVHPIVLGQGIKPFEGLNKAQKLKLIGMKEFGEGLIESHYIVER